MDQEQTFDIVDTPSKANWYFPTEEDFENREEVVKWREIERGIYKLHEVQDRGRNKYGPSVVLKLENSQGKKFLVWAPSSLAYAIQNRERTSFINNVGMKKSEKGNMYYDFKLL